MRYDYVTGKLKDALFAFDVFRETNDLTPEQLAALVAARNQLLGAMGGMVAVELAAPTEGL